MSAALVFESVSRRFGRAWALRDLSLGCASGGVTCLVGPNGAGKSTTLALAAGLLRPTAGRITCSGEDIGGAIGYLPQKSVFPVVLRAGEVFEFAARAAGAGSEDRAELLALTGLETVLDQQVRALSGGWLRRLGLACALLPQTGVLLLDEPFVGLDPETLDRLIASLKHRTEQGTVVLLSTHDFEAADRLRPLLGVLDEGKLLQTRAPGETTARAFYRESLGAAPIGADAVLGGTDVS